MWEKLRSVNIEDKEKYVGLFRILINQLESGTYNFINYEGEDYYIINEEKRKGSKFVHIVPKELINLFQEMKEGAPDEFLGFSVLINDVRVSCFGVPCSELTKAIINKQ
ncbi:MAG: hypothetical protein KJ879_01630 [Nanoarchaeota archaeon]|nr:hypothetical protein [Nanoarchaeota archaeon]